MTTVGARRDQRLAGVALLLAAGIWAILTLFVFPAFYVCRAGACPPPAFGLETLLALPLAWIGLVALVIGCLPATSGPDIPWRNPE